MCKAVESSFVTNANVKNDNPNQLQNLHGNGMWRKDTGMLSARVDHFSKYTRDFDWFSIL